MNIKKIQIEPLYLEFLEDIPRKGFYVQRGFFTAFDSYYAVNPPVLSYEHSPRLFLKVE
jgi:hypothetical protein